MRQYAYGVYSNRLPFRLFYIKPIWASSTQLLYSPDGETLATASMDGLIRIMESISIQCEIYSIASAYASMR